MENEKSFVTYQLKKNIIAIKNNIIETSGEVILTPKYSFLQDAKEALKNITPEENTMFIRDDDIPQVIIIRKLPDYTYTEIIGIIEV